MAKQIVAGSEGTQIGTNHKAIWRFLIDNEQVMRHRCRQVIRSPQDAEDALSELRLHLFSLLQRDPALLASIKNVTAWLRRVASNHCIDLIRKMPNTCDLERIDFDLQYNTCWQPLMRCPEHHTGLQEELRALAKAMQALPRQLSEILKQRCIDGAEYSELAIQLELSEPNARKRVQLARQQLRYQLASFSNTGAQQ